MRRSSPLAAAAFAVCAAGRFTLAVNLAALPLASGPIPAAPGQTWCFQAWFRVANPLPTSNFTDAVSVTLR